MTLFVCARYVLLLALCLCGPLVGTVETYFRPITTKGHSSGHSLPGIDFIYLINLDVRPEKLASTLAELDPYNIHPFRFSAVNGWDLPLEVINELGVIWEPGMVEGLWGTSYPIEDGYQPLDEIMSDTGRVYFCHLTPLGTIGCHLSHLSVLQHAYDSGYETIWVLEDDIEVVRSPHLLPDLIEELDEQVGSDGWDILFTDRDGRDNITGQYVPCYTYSPRPNFVPDPYLFIIREDYGKFLKVGARYSTHSMIIRRSGMEKILNFIKTYQLFLPIDMEIPQVPGIRLYTLADDVVTNKPRSATDNKAPFYLDNKGDGRRWTSEFEPEPVCVPEPEKPLLP